MNGLRALLIALACAFWVGDAAAHTSLLSASPADGSSLRTAPAEIVLRFDEPVAALAMRLVDDTGAAVSLEDQARSEGQTVRVALPSTMTHGAFVFSYRVASADSHPVTGSIAFTVGDVHLPSRSFVHEPGAVPLGARWIVMRALRDILLLAAAGAALFALCVGSFPYQRLLLCIGGVGAALLSVFGVGLQGAALMGQSFFASGVAFQAALQTSAGVSLLCTVAAAAAITIGAFVSRGAMQIALLWLGGLAAPASLAFMGHAAAAHPAWLSTTAIAVHALAAAFWTGSLAALFLLLRRRDAAAAPALRRFSAIAMPAVAVLIAGGTVFAWMQLASLRELAETRYGNLVLIKAVLLVTLLVIAARNRFVLLPRLERAAPMSGAALRRSITLEMAVMAVVVAFTAILSQTPFKVQ